MEADAINSYVVYECREPPQSPYTRIFKRLVNESRLLRLKKVLGPPLAIYENVRRKPKYALQKVLQRGQGDKVVSGSSSSQDLSFSRSSMTAVGSSSEDQLPKPVNFSRWAIRKWSSKIILTYESSPPRSYESSTIRALGSQDVGNSVLQQLADTITEITQGNRGEYRVRLKTSWHLLSFMKEQYISQSIPEIGSVIAISGFARSCQATTCLHYIISNWPTRGLKVLTTLQTAIQSKLLRSECADYEFRLTIEIDLNEPQVSFHLKGSKESIVEAVQILAWIGTVFQTSKTEEVCYSEPVLKPLSEDTFSLSFMQTPLPEDEKICWLSLFHKAVVAKGFPVPERSHDDIGLEISIEMMAALTGAHYAVSYCGGLVFKGPYAALVPVKRHNDSVQWHLVSNLDGKRIKYAEVGARCPNRLLQVEFDETTLRQTRPFLAWWGISNSYLGTECLHYEDICNSRASGRSTGVNLTDFSLGISHFGGGNVRFAIGLKDTPHHVSRRGRLENILDAADQMSICLFDLPARKAWLVSGTEVLLHLMRTRHKRHPYLVGDQEVALLYSEPGPDGPAASRRAIMQMASLTLLKNRDISNDDFYVKDLASQLWARLEAIEGDDGISDLPGVRLSLSFRKRLRGYEFLDIAMDKGLLRQKEAELSSTNGGWPKVIKNNDSIVLFGSKFGEMIKPAELSQPRLLCDSWIHLPESKDYLATTTRMITNIFGTPDEKGNIYSFGQQLQKQSLLFEPCCEPGAARCSCERLLRVVSISKISHMPAVPIDDFPKSGCIVIGQARLKGKGKSKIPNIFSLPNAILHQEPKHKSSDNVKTNRELRIPKVYKLSDYRTVPGPSKIRVPSIILEEPNDGSIETTITTPSPQDAPASNAKSKSKAQKITPVVINQSSIQSSRDDPKSLTTQIPFIGEVASNREDFVSEPKLPIIPDNRLSEPGKYALTHNQFTSLEEKSSMDIPFETRLSPRHQIQQIGNIRSLRRKPHFTADKRVSIYSD